MATKEVTPVQYADYVGKSVQNITKHLRAGNDLAHVLEVKKFSRFYLLVVDSRLKVNTVDRSIENVKARTKKAPLR